MSSAPKSAAPWAWAAALAALASLAVPIGDPDLWWHLSAARRMLETWALPRSEWMSFTRPGVPWVDFEWLSQLIFYGTWRSGGMGLLLALKAALLAGAGLRLDQGMARRRVPAPARAAAFAFWAAALIPRSDIRTELFSFVLFSALAQREEGDPPALPALAGMFALWANLHAGFAYGLLLLGAEAAACLPALFDSGRREAAAPIARRRLAALAAAAAGTLANPYGVQVYRVLWAHAREVGDLTQLIWEWAPLNLHRPPHWPTWAALASALWVAAGGRRAGRRALSPGRAAAIAALGLMTLRHCRVGPYFCALAIPWALPEILAARGPVSAAWSGRALALIGAFALWCNRSTGVFTRIWHDAYIPRRAALFLERNPALLSRNVYSPWGWGGYLGFRLFPSMRIFQDGRYIFHDLLLEQERAVRAPNSWREFLDLKRIDVAVVENVPMRVNTPAGSRPYYAEYFRSPAWALVHFDERALVFVRNGVLPLGRLEELEYRVLRPDQDLTMELSSLLRERGRGVWEAELARHGREIAALDPGPAP